MQATLTLSLTIVDSLGITTTTLPNGVVGQPYSVQCNVTGGTPPYTWSATNLPPGLSISADGLISGTPTASGTGDVTLTVTDAS